MLLQRERETEVLFMDCRQSLNSTPRAESFSSLLKRPQTVPRSLIMSKQGQLNVNAPVGTEETCPPVTLASPPLSERASPESERGRERRCNLVDVSLCPLIGSLGGGGVHWQLRSPHRWASKQFKSESDFDPSTLIGFDLWHDLCVYFLL